MVREFKLPDLGEGVHEGEVLVVLVKKGQQINEGDLILEVETDKAAVEIPSPVTGIVEKILVNPGDVVHVGDVLLTFRVSEDGSEVESPPEAAASAPAPMPEKTQLPEHRKKGPVPASPATRKLARELRVHLHEVTPTGPEGLVTAEDVRSHAQRSEPPTGTPTAQPPSAKRPLAARPILTEIFHLPDFSQWGSIEKLPVRSIRRAVAKQMTLSWSQIPHVANQDWVDITRLEAFRVRQKNRLADQNVHLTLTVFAIKAAVTALKKFPIFNASLDTQSGEIIIKHYYNIGIAVHTDDGLVVPVIRDVDKKSIVQLAVELNALVDQTKQRKITIDQVQGGTFTITNAGPMGGGIFTPIINYPEVAILGLGKARLKPAVSPDGESILSRLMMPIVLSFDHRVADGVDAIYFMKLIVDSLQDPDELFITMV